MDAEELKTRGYILGISLGEGSFAKVKSAYSEQLKTNVAIRIINKRSTPQDIVKKFLPREMEIVVSLNHSNILRTFDVFETSHGKVYMVMELAVQGDLLDLMKARGALPENLARKLFRQLSLAIQFMHDLDIVHRDLKCENLLLDEDLNLKISDFGFSRRLEYKDGQMVLSKTFCGSRAYTAPEVLLNVPYNPKVSDVWSMGVILFIMMCGSMPYNDSNVKKMLRMHMEHRLDFPRSTFVPTECKELIYRMLHPDVARRIESHDILEHVWLQERPESSDAIRGKPSNACLKSKSSKGAKKSEQDKEISEEPKIEATPATPSTNNC